MLKTKTVPAIFGFIIMVIGYAIIIWQLGWLVAVGILLIHWNINIESTL